MKKTVIILIFLTFCMVSCDKEVYKKDNFYKKYYRLGLWVNSPMGDTLQFVDDNTLIRKGRPFKHQEYLYRIEDEYLYLTTPNSSHETKHQISIVDKDKVKLSNMYMSVGFHGNSGVFTKVLR